jgi:hypothetical protein
MIARMTIQECGMSDAVLETLARDIERAPDDIKARYEILQGEKPEGSSKKVSELNVKMEDVYGDKDLDAALDSFDNLFCRRCLVRFLLIVMCVLHNISGLLMKHSAHFDVGRFLIASYMGVLKI